jgi:hypothetical protein
MRIILQPGFDGRESMAAYRACRSLGVPFVVVGSQFSEPGDVPIGSVEYCENVLGELGLSRPVPDFYPNWLADRLWRLITSFRVTRDDVTLQGSAFLKSADGYKVYPGKVYHDGHKIPRGRHLMSSLAQFVQEWRYYVAGGQVVASGWYDGSDDNEPAPGLSITWPAGFCGAVDFGSLSTGEIALVECHHGYACGWYGDDPELFILWQIECSETLVESLSHGETGFSRLKLPTIPGS